MQLVVSTLSQLSSLFDLLDLVRSHGRKYICYFTTHTCLLETSMSREENVFKENASCADRVQLICPLDIISDQRLVGNPMVPASMISEPQLGLCARKTRIKLGELMVCRQPPFVQPFPLIGIDAVILAISVC